MTLGCLVLGIFALWFLAAFIIGLATAITNGIHDTTGIPQPVTYTVLGLFIVCVPLSFAVYSAYQKDQTFRAIQIANIDSMVGVEFERYLQKLLSSRGYSVSMTQSSGDFGVDLIATGGSDRIAIQVKRYHNKISRRAISDAVAGMQHYRCNRAMVITNSHFTPGAITLARSTNCTLVDRDTLAQWIVQLQNAQTRAPVTSQPRNQHQSSRPKDKAVLLIIIGLLPLIGLMYLGYVGRQVQTESKSNPTVRSRWSPPESATPEVRKAIPVRATATPTPTVSEMRP